MRSLSSQHLAPARCLARCQSEPCACPNLLARASHTHRFPSGEFIHNTPTRKRSHQHKTFTPRTRHTRFIQMLANMQRVPRSQTRIRATPRVHAHVHVCLVASLGSLSGSLDGLSGSAIASFGVPSFGHLSSLSVLASLSGSALLPVWRPSSLNWFGRFLCTFDVYVVRALCHSSSLSRGPRDPSARGFATVPGPLTGRRYQHRESQDPHRSPPLLSMRASTCKHTRHFPLT